MAKKKIPSSIEAWESRELGCDEGHVQVVEDAADDAIDDALELQAISIRLGKGLIRDLKLIGQHSKIGYQPLIRQVLQRFVDCEMKQIARGALEAERDESAATDSGLEMKSAC